MCMRNEWIRRLLVVSGASLAALVSAGCESAPGTSGPALFFPAPPAPPRVQFLTWASGAEQVEPQRSGFEEYVFGDEPVRRRQINKPYGVAARDGVVYVCDTKGLCLCRLDFKNKTYSVLGTSGPGRLRKPLNVVMDELGYKFVVDSLRQQVVVFGPDDKYVTAFNISKPCRPSDVALHENELYVLDSLAKNSRIVVLDRTTGKELRTIGERGIDPGQFNVPNSLCIGPEGFLYVSDTLNFRVQKLTRDGQSVWSRGVPGVRLGQFVRPRGIRVGPDGIIYLVDGATEIVQMFDGEGRTLMRFGGPGNVPGALLLPSTLAIDSTSIPYFKQYFHKDFDVEYLLFVANQYGEHLINVYAFGSFPEGYRLSESEVAVLPRVPAEEDTQVPTSGPVEPEGPPPETEQPPDEP